jgi:mannose/fructose/N-acetylgalactosamine-specific phosphotransferase system component IID
MNPNPFSPTGDPVVTPVVAPVAPSIFTQLISSSVLWGLFLAIAIGVVKIVDPAIISTDGFATLEACIVAVCGILHVPVMFTANAAKFNASLALPKE